MKEEVDKIMKAFTQFFHAQKEHIRQDKLTTIITYIDRLELENEELKEKLNKENNQSI